MLLELASQFPSVAIGITLIIIGLILTTFILAPILWDGIEALKQKFPKSRTLSLLYSIYPLLIIAILVLSVVYILNLEQKESENIPTKTELIETLTLKSNKNECHFEPSLKLNGTGYNVYYYKGDTLGLQTKNKFINLKDTYFKFQDRDNIIMKIYKKTTNNRKIDEYLGLQEKYQIIMPLKCKEDVNP